MTLLAGAAETIPLILQDAAGAALVYANKAAFTGAGWDVVWYDTDGVALSSQPTWDLLTGTTASASDFYLIQYVVPSESFSYVIVPVGTNVAAPAGGEFQIDTATNGQIYGAILTSAGTLVSQTTINQDLTLYQGDSISVDMTIPEAALTAVGATSIATLDTYVAELKLVSTNATTAPIAVSFTESIVTDTAGARVVRAELDTFPTALNVDGPNGDSVSARLDLRITKGTKTRIASTVNITAVWAAAAGV